MSPSRNWDSSTPSSVSDCAPPPGSKGGGHTRLRVRGWGSPNSDDWRKSSALCLLCDQTQPRRNHPRCFCFLMSSVYFQCYGSALVSMRIRILVRSFKKLNLDMKNILESRHQVKIIPPPPPMCSYSSYSRALFVSKDRRYFLVTPLSVTIKSVS